MISFRITNFVFVLTLFLFSSDLFAQTPTISNISIYDIGHSNVNVRYNASASSFFQMKYGLSSGNYIYSSASYGPYSYASLTLGGLKPNTTYYLRVTARPNEDNDTNICNSSGCGAVEQVFTTLPAPSIHPEPPATATTWNPAEPDTSSYTVIPMKVAANGECVAAANISAKPGWSGNVLVEDNITAILGKIYYGTVIEFPQGAHCKVYEVFTYFHNGYQLPAKPDDSSGRWIIFRTAVNSPTDFPPYGVRTGPEWASRMAKFIIQTPAIPHNAGHTNTTGQVFQCYNEDCHHYWFQNLEMTNSTDVYPPGVLDPDIFGYPFQIEPLFHSPHHIVLDRVYIHSAARPSRMLGGVFAGGDNFALLSSYIDVDVWRPGLYPTAYLSIAGSTITVPKSNWGFNAKTGPTYGMNSGTTITVGGNGTLTCWLDSATTAINGLTCRFAGLSSAVCGSCSIAAGSETTPFSALRLFSVSVSAGTPTITYSGIGSSDATTQNYGLTIWKPMGVFISVGDSKTFDNNYVQAVGQTIYNDAGEGEAFADHVFTHNYLHFPRSKMQNADEWDGYAYTFRNVFETKQATRWKVEGNIFNGSAAFQNSGAVFMVAGSYPGVGTRDLLVRNNTFKHLSSGFSCVGGGAQRPPDAPNARRVEISNNLWLDLNRDKYNNGGGSLFSGPFMINPGCEDVNIHNNTVDLTLGPGPALLLMGSASDGASVMGEGLNISDNIMHLSLNALDAFCSLCGQISASHPANPSHACTLPSTSYTEMFNNAFMNIGTTITPSWNFKRNIIVGGKTIRGRSSWVDIDQAYLDTFESAFPPQNIFPRGETLAERRAAINWDPITYKVTPSSYNPGDIGANVDLIRKASGTVTDIRLTTTAQNVTFKYIAPDSRACSVDLSGNGTAWTRTNDGGGSENRTVTIPLPNSSGNISYRILCYFNQTDALEFPSDQITSGIKSFQGQSIPNPPKNLRVNQ